MLMGDADSIDDENELRREEMVLLIAAHQTRLRAFLRCLLVPGSDIEDVLQETNRILWQKALGFELGSDFWAWASQVARFEVLSYFRKRRRDLVAPDSPLVEQLASLATEELKHCDARRAALDECVSSLPSAQRQLLEMKYFSDQSISQISDQTNRTQGTICQTLYRIREALRHCVTRKLEGRSV
tara:strand:- start:3137 stop:3691 length:555 start_codon:yes stop_codon:yes gene_type:complete